MRRFLSVILILVGISIIVYPKAMEQYQEYCQKKLSDKWQESFSMLASNDNDLNTAKFQEVEKDTMILDSETVIGLLNIEKINLEVPILVGTTKENLNISVTTVEPTGKPGELGNMAIAGHNNIDYGRNFNRLEEIEKGDMIKVKTEIDTYSYEVTEKFYVKPNEVWVLEGDNLNSIITLITCYPRTTATQRLIVQGKLIVNTVKNE